MLNSVKAKIAQSGIIWLKVFKLLHNSSGRTTLAVAIATVVETVLGLGTLYAIKHLVDSISSMGELTIVASQARLEGVYLALGITGLVILLSVLSQSVSNFLRMKQGFLVADFVDRRIHAQANTVDYAFYESPVYHDSLQRAREAGSQRPAQVVSNIVSIGRSAITLIGILVLLAAIEWRLLPALMIILGVALLVRLHFSKSLFAWRTLRTQQERRAGYLDWMITSQSYAKEMRLNGLGPYFAELFSSIRTNMRTEEVRIEQRRMIFEFGVATVGAIIFFAATVLLFQRTMEGELSLGQVVLFVLLFRRAESSGNELVSQLSRVVEDQRYLGQLFAFLDLQPKKPCAITIEDYPTKGAIVAETIQFHGVSFVYEGAAERTLRNVNFQISPGQIVAVVGENGSGKTSLIKLLTRLYDPTEGVITLGGKDIRTLDPERYRALFSVIFQDYAHYAETVTDNIRFGDVQKTQDPALVAHAAKLAGASSFIEGLPNGYDTPLTKLFDHGHDLSVGQWQRLALARSFYPSSSFIIMDEPTSAVDPRAEFELFDSFRERLGGRGALVISHRLSTVRLADYTYVMDAGSILEHGTHDKLIEKGGRYAKLFEQQANYYR